jgi:hypothetical protein
MYRAAPVAFQIHVQLHDASHVLVITQFPVLVKLGVVDEHTVTQPYLHTPNNEEDIQVEKKADAQQHARSRRV